MTECPSPSGDPAGSSGDLERLLRRKAELEAELQELCEQLAHGGRTSDGRGSAADPHRILESATDYAILTTDLTGRVTTWNEGARRILGWDDQEVLGDHAEVIFTPEDRAAGVPWQEIAGMRDRLIHHYAGVNWDIVWDVIQTKLPELRRYLATPEEPRK